MKGPGKTLAMAALVAGVLSLPTAGGFCLGAVVAVSLGVASLGRSRRDPAADNGRELAIAGIVAAVASLLAAVPLGMLVVAWRQGNLLEDVRILSEWPEPKAGLSPPLAPGWAMPAPPPLPPPRASGDAPPPPPPPPPPPQPSPQPSPQPAAGTARRNPLPLPGSPPPGAGSTDRKPSPSASQQPNGGETPSSSSTPVAVPTARKAASPVRVGGNIKEPRRLKMASPVYPDLARQQRVQGIVILECIIGVEGDVSEVKVLRSIPQLDSAAVEAVRQWVYEPTLLNGTPVPVIMTVTVNFKLN